MANYITEINDFNAMKSAEKFEHFWNRTMPNGNTWTTVQPNNHFFKKKLVAVIILPDRIHFLHKNSIFVFVSL